GSGLSSLSLTAIHAAGSPLNSWASADGTLTGQVTFDLHGAYTLIGMSVWNLNSNGNAGVQGVGVSTSTDGVTFTPLAGGPTTTPPRPPHQFTSAPVTPPLWHFNTTTNSATTPGPGLSEVAFAAPLLGGAVPPPPTLLLGLVGAGCVARLRRKPAGA